MLSLYFIKKEEFENIEDYYKVGFAVLNHHNYCDGLKIIEDREYTKEDLQRCESEIMSYIMSHSSKNGDINKLQNQYSNVFRIIVK